jgi:hypothetical protein
MAHESYNGGDPEVMPQSSGSSDSLAQGICGNGVQSSVLLGVAFHSLPHGPIQQLYQLALCLFQQLSLHSLQDKARAESSVPPSIQIFFTHQTFTKLLSGSGTAQSTRDRRMTWPCPELPQQLIWLPRAAVRIKNDNQKPGVVDHTCNPNYSGG